MKRAHPDHDEIKTEDVMADAEQVFAFNGCFQCGRNDFCRSSRKKAKVRQQSVAKPALAGARRPAVGRKTVAPVPKRQAPTPPDRYQQSGDDLEALERGSAIPRYVFCISV